MKDFEGLLPFWELLNENGYKVGLWAADSCLEPIPIEGYTISTRYEMLNTPKEDRTSPRSIEVCEQDRALAQSVLSGNPIYRLYPKTLSQQGYSFDELKKDADLAEKAIAQYHFQDSIENFRQELEYWFSAMCKAQRLNPVDGTRKILQEYAQRDSRVVPFYSDINRNFAENHGFWLLPHNLKEGDLFAIPFMFCFIRSWQPLIKSKYRRRYWKSR